MSLNATDSEIFHEANEYDEFHYNQTQVGKEIIRLFEEGKHYVQLQAQMQSGKTGTCLYSLFEMIRKYKTNGFILSGMSDIDIKAQWVEKLKVHQHDYMAWIDNIEERKTIPKLIENVKEHVYFNNDLKKIKTIEELRNSLLIIDEIHYGATEYSQLSNVFKVLDIQDILTGKNSSKLVEYNIKILSVSATRAVEDTIYNDPTNTQVKQVWGRVYMTPGDNYKGIIQYYNANQIKPSIDFKEPNRSKIIQLLESYKSQNKYIVIRATGVKATFIESILNDLSIPIEKYDQNNTHVFDTVQPTQFTAVLIKGKLRLGKELNKTHICSVFESSDNSMNNDTLLQGLLGRVCGYNITQDIHIYIPRTPEQITDLVQKFDSINRHEAIMGLDKTKFVPQRKANKIDHVHTPNVSIMSPPEEELYSKYYTIEEELYSKYYTIPQIIPFGNGADEDFELSDIVDKMDIKPHIPELLSKLEYSQYSEKQNHEINQEITRLKESDNNITIRFSHDNNKTPPLQYIGQWETLDNCILYKKQFTLFDSKPIIVIIVKNDIPDTSFKKHNAIVIFRLNNKNTIIEQPFMKPKMGEMHTPKNDLVTNSETHTTIEDYTSIRCKEFENSKNLLKEIKAKINYFTSEPDNQKILRLRHSNDVDYPDINKSTIAKNIYGIKSNIKKKDLENAIRKLNIPNISISSIDIPGKNDKNLRETTGLYIFKEIKIVLLKK
jgi:hypothetical protein